jgi:hypothetical protein
MTKDEYEIAQIMSETEEPREPHEIVTLIAEYYAKRMEEEKFAYRDKVLIEACNLLRQSQYDHVNLIAGWLWDNRYLIK